MAEDSVLSIAANVAGLLTFAFAALGAVGLRVNQLRGFRDEISRLFQLVSGNFDIMTPELQQAHR